MIDEGELRQRFPEIPWDHPERITITSGEGAAYYGWLCRYCVAMHGLKAADVIAGKDVPAWQTREEALDHIETVHHD